MMPETSALETILSIWKHGGIVMIPLFLLSVLLYATAFHLLFYVYGTRLDRKNRFQWPAWVANPELASGRVAKILHYTQDRVTTSKQIRNRFEEVRLSMTQLLDRQLVYLNTLVATAPLLGLLGTVLGMLQTFFGISNSGGAETAAVVAGGISEALVTTQTGLTIALPGLFIVMIVRRKKHAIEAAIARLESLTLTHFKFE
jgi:biopolymer transport protein ExbB